MEGDNRSTALQRATKLNLGDGWTLVGARWVGFRYQRRLEDEEKGFYPRQWQLMHRRGSTMI